MVHTRNRALAKDMMDASDEELDDRPWEKPGQMRRDYESHRGGLLLFLGTASVVCSALSLCAFCLGVVSVPLGATTWVMAESDLKKMRSGDMDPAGLWQTKAAARRGFLAIAVTLLGWLCGWAVGVPKWFLNQFMPHWN